MTAPTQTEAILQAMLQRLQDGFAQELSIELFPDNPAGYRLNHPTGAVLLSYGRSTFPESEATDVVFQDRDLVFRLTLVFRQLNGPHGAVAYLDRLRDQLTGFKPPHCDKSCRPQAEQFIGQLQGLWQYAQDYTTRATQLQTVEVPQGPKLANAHFEEVP